MEMNHTSNNPVMLALGLVAVGGIATWLYQSLGTSSKEQEEKERRRRIEQQEATERERKRKEEEEGGGKPRLLCYFGSQTGTAEGFAKTIAETSKRFGFVGKVIDLEEFDQDDFEAMAREQSDKVICVFCLATYGEGDPSDNAVGFANYLKDESFMANRPLEGLRFTVFGLGNKQYEHYNAMGRLVQAKLEAFGARSVYPYGEGDDDGTLQEDFNSWVEDLHLSLRKEQFGEGAGAGEDDSETLVKPDFLYESKYLTNPPTGNDDMVHSGGRFEESKRKVEAGKLDLASRPYFKTEAFKVKSIKELRKSPGADGLGSTLHVELELPEAVRSYGTAFNLSIMTENDMDLVERTAKALGWSSADLDRWIAIRPKQSSPKDTGPLLPSPCTLRIALQCGCSLNSVPGRSVIQKLAYFATNKEHQTTMMRMCSKEGKQELHELVVEPRLSLAELVERFDSIRFEDPCEFLEICPRMAARDYTIASSSKENPRVLALTVSVVREPLPNGREFRGVCTNSLLRRKRLLDQGKPCDPVYAFVKPSSFILPDDPSIPVAFIGPGTGIAPMRALMQERRWLREHAGARLGPGLLFFGCRRKDEDYIYESEFEQFKRSGAVSNVFVAFSREHATTKVYVQEHVKAQGDLLWDWIGNKQGHIYVCGGTLMGKDVHATLVAIAQKCGKLTDVQAKDYIQRMSNEGRLVQELWS